MQSAAEAADLRFALVGVDASAGMIERARAKTWPAGYGARQPPGLRPQAR
jgi:hypothetical protein